MHMSRRQLIVDCGPSMASHYIHSVVESSMHSLQIAVVSVGTTDSRSSRSTVGASDIPQSGPSGRDGGVQTRLQRFMGES